MKNSEYDFYDVVVKQVTIYDCIVRAPKGMDPHIVESEIGKALYEDRLTPSEMIFNSSEFFIYSLDETDACDETHLTI